MDTPIMDTPETERRVAVIIEDDDDIRHLLEAVLTQAGFEAIATSNGVDGVRAVRAYDPIVTTLDVSMPGMDGLETAKRIRSFSPTYIVMLTARDEEIDTLQGLEAGADDYVTKPFRPRELRARIDAMMRRPRQSLPAPGTRTTPSTPSTPSTLSMPSTPSTPETPDTPPALVAPDTAASADTAAAAETTVTSPTPQTTAPVEYQPTAIEYQPVPRRPAQFRTVPAPQPVHYHPAPPVGFVPTAPAGYGRAPAGWMPAGAMAPGTPPPASVTGQAGAGGPSTALARREPAAPTPAVVPAAADWMEHNGLRLSPGMRLAVLGGTELDLTRTEFDLLAALLDSQRRVRSKADLALLLRGESYVTAYYVNEADKRAVEAHMGNLRRKLGDSLATPRWLETVRGVGYRLAASESD
jgi:two-component system, OmpR family, response regulator